MLRLCRCKAQLQAGAFRLRFLAVVFNESINCRQWP